MPLFFFFIYSIFLDNILFPLIAFCFLNSSATQFYPTQCLRTKENFQITKQKYSFYLWISTFLIEKKKSLDMNSRWFLHSLTFNIKNHKVPISLYNRIGNKIIIIIISLYVFFTPSLAGGLSLESKGQQVSTGLQDSSQYSSWSQQ